MDLRVNVRHDYAAFLRAKVTPGVTYDGDFAVYPQWAPIAERGGDHLAELAPHLHEYQRFAVAFAVARKRAALFMACGAGKCSCSLAWLRSVADGKPAMIAAPLAAQHEFINEVAKFYPGMDLRIIPTGEVDEWLADPQGVALVTHHAFIEPRELSGLAAFVLDESSILKSGSGAIAMGLIASCQPVPLRLALSATPAPNEPSEFATHSTFLGYMRSDAEFRARFFVHDGKDWRMKRHAVRELPRWLSRFALWLDDPSVYSMPCPQARPEDFTTQIIRLPNPPDADALAPRNLLGEADGVVDLSLRCKILAAVYADPERTRLVVELARGRSSIVWATRNAHADALEKSLREAGVKVAQIAGVTSDEERVATVRAFQSGEVECIVSKAGVIGHGVNLQRCDRMIFAGYNESYEALHQAIRRGHRQGRRGSMEVYMIATPDEEAILTALDEKGARWAADCARQEREFATALEGDVSAYREGREMTQMDDSIIRMDDVTTEHFRLLHGDSIALMADEPAESVDLAVFSPPFSSLYTYSSNAEDMGNCADGDAEFNIHFAHFADALMRLMKPGRICCLHLSQLVAFRSRQGRKGLRDFRGTVIRVMEESGWLYYGEFVIPKNPQASAIRTKSERLQFVQLRRNSLESSPALNDYVLEFRKPGESEAIVQPDVNNEEWISWASGVWDDIRETDVLTGWMNGRGENDEKHICPLQLPVIDRCIRLWSNPGEVVFSPFAGIGSEVYQAILRGRFGLGMELKAEYFRQAVDNCNRAVAATRQQLTLEF